MATKITVALEDDLDGGPAVETVRFAVGGAEYEIDLNKKNAAAFRKQLAPFVEHARRPGRGPRRRAGRSAAVSAVLRSGRGRNSGESRSAPAGASRRM
jgi:Lsr2